MEGLTNAHTNPEALLDKSPKGSIASRDRPPPPPASLSRVGLLTEQQRRVFVHLSEGLTNKQIARRLGLHESTVKVHVSAVLAKLGCPNRTAAALVALYHQLLPLFANGDDTRSDTNC